MGLPDRYAGAGVRDADAGEMAFGTVGAVLDGDHPVETLAFDPGDLVLMVGFGAGMSSAAAVVRWDPPGA